MAVQVSEIDRSSPVPVYYQIAVDIKSRIMRHEWDLNQRLPTETELAAQYEVSRITLRQAIAELEKDGIVKKERGRGAYIHADPSPYVNELNYILASVDRITQNDRFIKADILEQRIVTDLFPAVYEHLHIEPTNEAVYIKRLFSIGGRPVAICRSHIPVKLAPGLDQKDLVAASVSNTLKKYYSLSPVRVDDYIEAVRSTKSESMLLNCASDTPLILIEGTSFLEGDIPLEYSCTIWSGDYVRFHLPLTPGKDGFRPTL